MKHLCLVCGALAGTILHFTAFAETAKPKSRRRPCCHLPTAQNERTKLEEN